ncbi:MAG: DUF883 domain-containing protein [Burkholderiaceae bacterium]|nr:DUF883 domain-containing protein [Burkholderiaceae bacterium]
MANADRERLKLALQKERLAFDTKELISSAEQMLRTTASYTGAEIDQARDRLRHQLTSAKDKAQDWNHSLKENVQGAATATEKCVRDRPWTFIGAAFVVGIGLAHLLRGDKRDQ